MLFLLSAFIYLLVYAQAIGLYLLESFSFFVVSFGVVDVGWRCHRRRRSRLGCSTQLYVCVHMCGNTRNQQNSLKSQNPIFSFNFDCIFPFECLFRAFFYLPFLEDLFRFIYNIFDYYTENCASRTSFSTTFFLKK